MNMMDRVARRTGKGLPDDYPNSIRVRLILTNSASLDLLGGLAEDML
jgi:hypothetical protein